MDGLLSLQKEKSEEIMARFFVEPNQIGKEIIQITDPQDIIHIKNVLRLQKGDKLLVSDGQKMDYEVIINKIGQDEIIVTIENKWSNENEPVIQVVLFQGMPKADKFEWIIQKAVELGVHQIIPVMTTRTVVKITDAQKTKKKVERWNKIIEGAAKQSGRGMIPLVLDPISYDEALEMASRLDHVIIPYEEEKEGRLGQVLPIPAGKSIGVFIGPEGGFTTEEIQKAIECKIQPITLGKRILRTETAGLAVLSIIMYEAGEV